MAVQTVAIGSMTRSGRRNAPGTATTTAKDAPKPKTRAFAHQTRNTQNIAHQHGGAPGRTKKRQLSSSDRRPENPPAKRSRSSDFEIVLPSNKDAAHRGPQNRDAVCQGHQPDHATTTAETATDRVASQRNQQKRKAQPQQQQPPTQETSADRPIPRQNNAQKPARGSEDAYQSLTKHQAKVVNGIRHELKSLQPSEADTNASEASEAKPQRGGRKLRSQEATRFKSELSAYFPEYDEVIGNEPKEQHLLNVETPIVLVDSHPRQFQGKVVAPLFTSGQTEPATAHHAEAEFPIRGYGDALFDDLFDSQRINFDFLGNSYHKGKTLQEDPLSDELYLPVHKKAERLEKSIRNTEKGRAQHEKDQIARLLDGLHGHDWLRTMGVSGVTESKKKTFEPARHHFIKGCQAILDKFRQWGLEEKRRKAEKERALAEEAERAEAAQQEEEGEEEAIDDEDGEEGEEEEGDEDEDEGDEEEEEEEIGDSQDEGEGNSDGSETDVDASIAKQLREEAAARSRITKVNSRKRPRAASKPAVPASPPKPAPPPPPPPELKSFFRKKHERDAALNRHRRTGRRVLAWGEPVPDMREHEFELPEDLLDSDIMKVHARKRRRELRSSKH